MAAAAAATAVFDVIFDDQNDNQTREIDNNDNDLNNNDHFDTTTMTA
jgi:hypothetical protein